MRRCIRITQKPSTFLGRSHFTITKNFFNYENSSEDDHDSLHDSFTYERQEKPQTGSEIFKQVFNPNFVSINQFKEDDDEFMDLTMNNNTKKLQ